MKAYFLTSAAALAVLSLPGIAHAQAADESGAAGSEIIVTANKRTERVQEVPSSIAVVNNTALERQGVTRLEDLQRAVPGLAMTSSTGQSHSTIAVRGVFSNNISAGIPAAVGVVIDDLPQPVDARGFNELVDIERIEVLRGPQSTISGRNSAAGLINIVTRGPSKTLKVDASQTVTTDQEYRTALFVSGPLGDNAGASLSGYYNDWAGNIRNLATNKKEGKQSYGVRGRLELRPAEGVTIQAMGYYQHLNEQQGTPLYQYFGAGALVSGALPPAFAFGDLTPGGIVFDRHNQLVNSTAPVFQHTNSYGGSLRATIDIGKLQLMSISGYQREDNDTVQDALGVNAFTLNFFPGWDGTQRSQGKLTVESQELRLISPASDRLSYVLGLFYSATNQDAAFQRVVFFPYNSKAFVQYKNYAAYARATFRATDQVSILGGLRYNADHGRYSQTLNGPTSANKATDEHLLGDISLQYRPVTDVMLYGRYAHGLQGMGFDLNAPVPSGTPIAPTAPGGVDSFEIGAKTQFLDRRLTLNVAAYTSVFKNYLSQKVNSQLIFELVNVGKVRARGFEIEASLKATDALSLNFSGAYTDATYRNYTGAQCFVGQTAAQGCVGGSQNLTGKRLAVSPEWQMSGGFEYVAKLPSAPFDVSFRADASYQTEVFFDSPGSPNKQDAYGIVNLSASLLDHNDHWKLTAFVNNVTDKEHTAGYADIGGVILGNVSGLQTRSLPRDFRRYGGVRLNVTF
ncbi:TonB-dependent receptor [Novosphingobium bradum]|uniref:TonB-dependent receptor n=1 Tax=Novosphingobium bradum TaxID=1737444 RepID=A0ABV7INK8_9SPHN